MVTSYILFLVVGGILLVVSIGRARSGFPGRRQATAYADDELTVPGARIEPSDDFAVEGGAGGAEGEAGTAGYRDGADGGVGGAEGGEDRSRRGRPGTVLGVTFGAALASFGAAGLLLGAGNEASRPSVQLALLYGILAGVLAGLVARFAWGPRDDRSAP